MALREIVLVGEDVLRKKSRPVTKFDKRLHSLIEDMRETLELAKGTGLAAPQVGILRRVIIIDIGEGIMEFINPEIIAKEGIQEFVEGCLSVPGKRGNTIRPAKVTVKYQDRHGEELLMEGEEILAIAFCHEIDHLNGVLYTDIVVGDIWEVEE